MDEEKAMTVPRNPPKAPEAMFDMFGVKLRGDAVYICFGGLLASVLVFIIALDVSIFLAAGLSWIPFAASAWFYIKFVHNRPKGYFDYWLVSQFNTSLRRKPRKVKK